jgi:hypothetical protein
MQIETERAIPRKPTQCPECRLPIRIAVAFIANKMVTVRYEHSNGDEACVVSRPLPQ